MDFSGVSRDQLSQEGMANINFEDLNSYQLEKSINNLHMAIPGMPYQVDPNGGFFISQKCLKSHLT